MRNIWIGLALVAMVAVLAWLALGGSGTSQEGVTEKDANGVTINRADGSGKTGDQWSRKGNRAAVGDANQMKRNGERYNPAKEKVLRERMKVKHLSHDELVSRQEDFNVVGKDITLLAEQYEAEGDYKKAYETMLPYYRTSDMEAQMYTDKLRRKYFAQKHAEAAQASESEPELVKH